MPVAAVFRVALLWRLAGIAPTSRRISRRWPRLLPSASAALGTRLLGTAREYGDYVILGIIGTTLEVGLYFFAFRIAVQPIRVVAQSFGGWPYARTGGPVKTETDPLDPTPAPGAVSSLAALRHLETAVVGYGEGLALRYGGFYGPGTTLSADGPHTELVRQRRFPVVGGGGGIWSFCHIDDAASATVAAVERGAPGLYNVCDDEPAPVRDWLPVLPAALGAKPPRHVPAWLARPLIGAQGMVMMTTARGMSNAKAKRELDWTPAHPSWRDGFRTLGDRAGVGDRAPG